MRRKITLLLASAAVLSGCTGLPEAGPRTDAVEHNTSANYHLVPLTSQIALALDQTAPLPDYETMFAALPEGRPQGCIAPGDLLQITLWEANPTGATLLTPPGLQTALRVDASGAVMLPYIGTLHVAGETALTLQRRIMGILQSQGHSIQAAVLNTQPSSDIAILAGDVSRPGIIPLTASTASLLGAIAESGGARDTDDETLVRLRRDGVTVEAPLAAIDNDSALDVALAPGDSVTLLPLRRSFYAFGAINHPGVFPYDAPRISLLQALAETAGLQDERAAPRGVFIYRPAPAQTIYQLNLSQPQGFFIANSFALDPGDLIYVSDAPVADVTKVLQTITGVGTVAGLPRNFGAPY